MERISWLEAIEFCARLSTHTDRTYTLPSEAQWEYACRAGTETAFSFGPMITAELANYANGTAYNNGPQSASPDQTTSVGQYPANAYGLYDMHGNVWEWCLDHWHGNYNGAPRDGSAWLSSDKEALILLRGGSWNYNPRYCRSAARDYYPPDYRRNRIGFRVVSLPQDSA